MHDASGPGPAGPAVAEPTGRTGRFVGLVGVSLLVTAAANMAPPLVSALAVQIQDDLGIGESEIGLTVSVFFLVGAATSALAGRTVERVGPAASLRVAAAMGGAMLVLGGVIGRSWAALLVCVAAAGLGNSLAQPAANLYLARGVPAGRMGFALGVQKSGIPTASLLAGLAVPTIGLTIGWHWAFVLGGLLAFAVSLAVRPTGAPAAVRTGRERAGVGADGSVRAGAGRDRPRPDVPVRILFAVAYSTSLASMGSMALGSFFVLSSVEIGIGEAAAAILLVVGSIIGIVTRLVIGASADRTSISPWHMLSAMFAVAAVAFVGFAAGSQAIMFAAMPFAFATSFAWPGLFHYAVVRANPSAPGAATGITMTGGFTGAVCGPLLFGVLVEATGYGWAWGAIAAASVAAAVSMAIVSRQIEDPST